MATRKKTPPQGDRTYYVKKSDNSECRVTVPASWKVTFGPIWTPTKGHHGDFRYAMRFYEGAKENQRMVIVDVCEFRDMSIQVMEKVKKSKRETYYKDSPFGQKAVVAEAIIEEWLNPDEPKSSAPDPEVLTLEHKPAK